MPSSKKSELPLDLLIVNSDSVVLTILEWRERSFCRPSAKVANHISNSGKGDA